MLDNLLILITVVAVLAFFKRFYGNKSLTGNGDELIYKYPKLITWIPVVGMVVLALGSLWDYMSSPEQFLDTLRDTPATFILTYFGFYPIGIAGFIYFKFSVFFVGNNILKKRSIFGETVINYQDIKKIVVDHSGGNPGAGSLKIYSHEALGNKRIKVEALIEGYESLVAQVLARAPKHVEVIEKGK